eukprot:TRINITY_DN32835_c0_g1_i1.p1 TRINITY_DN32835_c0_g1~~TRINITY_DN32835_c0_g1_i1.p1  ORF type:complete len:685 (-),score=105.60 TRINITY_DN32835_c0_g1_i1:24-2039(-)
MSVDVAAAGAAVGDGCNLATGPAVVRPWRPCLTRPTKLLVAATVMSAAWCVSWFVGGFHAKYWQTLDKYTKSTAWRVQHLIRQHGGSQPGWKRDPSPCNCSDQDGLVFVRTQRPGFLLNEPRLREEWRSFYSRLDDRKYPGFNISRQTHWRTCTTCKAREVWSASPAAVPVGVGAKQLFADDFLVQSATGVRRFLAAPASIQEVKSMNWIGNQRNHSKRGFGFPGSVVHNGTHFMMFYRSMRMMEHHPRGKFAMAASIDGLKWTEVKLNENVEAGYTFELCVTIDWFDKVPDRRFKLVYACQQVRRIGRWEACMATSPDGITWHDHGHIFGRSSDTQACIYRDAPEGDYTLVLRQEFPTPYFARGVRGTKFVRVTEAELNKAMEKKDQMLPNRVVNNFYFDRYGKDEQYERQSYSFTRTLYEGVHFGMIQSFEWPALNRNIGMAWTKLSLSNFYDAMRVYLATSRDGVHFNFDWVYAMQPLQLAAAKTAKVQRMVFAASEFVTMAGQHWLYYTTHDKSHNFRFGAPEIMHLARWPQDMLTGLEPTYPEGPPGRVVTKVFAWPPEAVAVKVTVDAKSAYSFVAVEVLRDSGGFAANATAGAVARDTYAAAAVAGRWPAIHVRKAQPEFCLLTEGRVPRDLGFARLAFTLSGTARLFAFVLVGDTASCVGRRV